MASKLAVFAALFVCFLVADASFRVTTTVVEDENPQQQQQYQQCRQQLQGQRLRSCHTLVSSQQQSRRDWDIIQMNPQQSIQQCCQELQQVDRECRCEALEQIQEQVQQDQQQRGSSIRGSQLKKIEQQVLQIPQMCSIQVPQQCQQMY